MLIPSIDLQDGHVVQLIQGERLAIEAFGARKPFTLPELPKPQGPGKAWTAADLTSLAAAGIKGRNFENGRKAFAAARCVICHRFAGDGGATGPDLTQLAGRFNVKDLSESRTAYLQRDGGQGFAFVVHDTEGNALATSDAYGTQLERDMAMTTARLLAISAPIIVRRSSST